MYAKGTAGMYEHKYVREIREKRDENLRAAQAWKKQAEDTKIELEEFKMLNAEARAKYAGYREAIDDILTKFRNNIGMKE